MRRTDTKAITLLVAMAFALALALALAGCAQVSPAEEQKAKCFANETLVGAEMKLLKADSGMDAPFQIVLDKTHVVCPSGGTYSYDTTSGVVTCSIHGHR